MEAREDWPYALDCNHEDAIGVEWDRIELAAQALGVPDNDIEYTSPELTRLQEGAKSFTDRTVEEISVGAASGGITVVWTCPVCHEEHTEEYSREDFVDA